MGKRNNDFPCPVLNFFPWLSMTKARNEKFLEKYNVFIALKYNVLIALNKEAVIMFIDIFHSQHALKTTATSVSNNIRFRDLYSLIEENYDKLCCKNIYLLPIDLLILIIYCITLHCIALKYIILS